MKFALLAASFTISLNINAQTNTADTTIRTEYLPQINLVGANSKKDFHFLPEVVGTQINAGKKNALIITDNVHGNVVTNTMRQVLAKVAGIQIWESDPSGIQIGIAARGLSPNRSWEFNIRQNGYDISSDPFGYPEAYYTPQLNAVQRVQIIRGAGSLQYGPQFGGMVNFIMKDGSDILKPLKFETQQTLGSFGLYNSFNSIGGTKNKLNYYCFLDRRSGNGSRPNSNFNVSTAYGTVGLKATEKLKVNLEYTYFNYLSKQAGGLTDLQFAENHLQSFRTRNWFDVNWNILALNTSYQINKNSQFEIKISGMLGKRNSVGFLSTPNIADTINKTTFNYNNRRLDRDEYRNGSLEIRYVNHYKIGKIENTVATGIRYFEGNTHRLQNGVGDVYSDNNTNLVGAYIGDVKLKTKNFAAFAENILKLNKNLLLIPGIRLENISNSAKGRVGFNTDRTEIIIVTQQKNRNFILAGLGMEYLIKKTSIYGNISQAYRPVLFSDLIANPTTDIINPNLSDATGYNMDLGYRGKVKEYLTFDMSIYYLKYNNRIGTITQQNVAGGFYNYKTNVGNSISRGAELFAEFTPTKLTNKVKKMNASIFASVALIDAKYDDLKVVTKQGTALVETSLKGNSVENAPKTIIRSGISFTKKGFVATAQYSFVGTAFSDANNTVTPVNTGTNGMIPEYKIVDITASYKINNNYYIKSGVNNLLNEKYFTRRSGGYPGPGILSGEPTNFFISFGASF